MVELQDIIFAWATAQARLSCTGKGFDKEKWEYDRKYCLSVIADCKDAVETAFRNTRVLYDAETDNP